MPLSTDLDLKDRDVTGLGSADAIAGLLGRLGYPTDARATLTPESIGLSGDAAGQFSRLERLAKDDENFLHVMFGHVKRLTVKAREDLVRVLGRTNDEYLVILADAGFECLEFVLIERPRREQAGPGGVRRVQIVSKIVGVRRRSPSRIDLRTIRRLSFTGADGLEQYDKLKSVFNNAAYSGEHFINHGLFADHFLKERLKDDAAWRENPTAAFASVCDLMKAAQGQCPGKDEPAACEHLFEPMFRLLGFSAEPCPPSKSDADDEQATPPDYALTGVDSNGSTVAFVYAWDRWLDGPDLKDKQTPDENPGACVVSALDAGIADWVVVTNGRLWRLYSRHAHARATNFYEVDLVEALATPGESDPNEAFRYWWLFFRAGAFGPCGTAENDVWLDAVLRGSRDYAKRLGDRLKDRIFVTIFPHLASGFLADRDERLKRKERPDEEELAEVFEGTLTLLYRLLFLLYAESRDLLPLRETAYGEASLKALKDEVAEKADRSESEVPARLATAYRADSTALYDRLGNLFRAMDKGDPSLNVPAYNGGLFNTSPDASDRREQRIARFLVDHKVPDRLLALAIDRLSRDVDERIGLVPIDYQSLEVRHLGSIYEGLLEFRLKVAEADLAAVTVDKKEKYVPLAGAKGKKSKAAEVAVWAGEVYLSNDKAERKASGSYYTPDPIVEYIVAHAVGPVLEEKLDALRGGFRDVRKTYDRYLANEKARPSPGVDLKSPKSVREFVAEKTYHTHKDLVERLFDLKVIDPAMGSGHFLVEAVDFITDRLITFLNAFPVNPVGFALERTRSSILASLDEQGVGVDPDKLTDINLLKRHVLKRCIYGVDLNPMAVELAKVSLWLDAFTLGAPLSFLDHHLRCGNSLVGATFADLEEATIGRVDRSGKSIKLMFHLDYGPLMRAINHVLIVSKMADATAAEVADSVREYDEAFRSLSGYRIVLDLLTADHFGVTGAKTLVTVGKDLDLTDRDRFVASLIRTEERDLIAIVEALARRPDLQFFHWEIEFPEVFFGFTGVAGGQIQHKDRIKSGSAGFDAILGNPPYVRQETFKSLKPYFKASYQTFDSTNDLYVYFLEAEVRSLRANGRMGMIVANKWMRAGYGEPLRGYLRRVGQPLEVIDFGHSPIFPDADTFPCILLVAKRSSPLDKKALIPDGEEMVVCQVPREQWDRNINLITHVNTSHHLIPTKYLQDAGWSLENPVLQELIRV